jgi:hypothetical protein
MTLVSPTQVNPNDEITDDSINAPVNQLAAVINGNIDDTNIASVSGSKLSTGTVSTAKIADASITNAKLATSAGETGAAWTAWTPTWTNLTVGNGTVLAAYKQIGKVVFARYSIVFGSTSSISGAITFTLPVTSVTYGTSQALGSGFIDDAATATYAATVCWLTTGTATLYSNNSSASALIVQATTNKPIASYGTGDSIKFSFTYEAA